MARTNHVINIQVTADASKAQQGLGQVEQKASGLQDKLGAFGKAAVGFLAVKAFGAVKDFVDGSIDAYSELEQATGATEAIFGDQAKAIDRWAKAAAENIGMSESAAKNAAVKIGAFLQNYGFSVDEAAQKSMELTNLGADLAAMFGGTVPEAVDAISAALRGEFNPIERYGVSLRVATIEAHALEMGLAKTKGELDQNAKMLATLDLITKQTAGAQGQFARELDTVAGQSAVTAAKLENQKAIVGETIVAYREWGNVLTLEMGKALADLAIGIQEVTGALSRGEGAIRKFELATGQTVTTVDDLIKAGFEMQEMAADNFFEDLFNDWGEAQQKVAKDLPKVIEGMELTTEELLELKGRVDELSAAYGLNDEQAAELAETLDRELRKNAEEATRAYMKQGGAASLLADDTENLTDAVDENADAIKRETDRIKEQIDWLQRSREEKRREVDATYNLVAANRDVEQAQKDYNEAVKNFGPTSDEAVEAAQELWGKQQALIDAALTFKKEAGPSWEEGFRKQQESAGVSAETIQAIIDKVNNLDGVIRDVNGSTIDIKANVRVPKFKFDQKGNYVTPSQTGTAVFHQGGTFRADTPGGEGFALLRDGEKVYTPDQARQLELGGGGGQPNVIISVGGAGLYTKADVGRMIVEALQQYIRTAGALPADIRIGS